MSRGLDNFHSQYLYRVLRPNESPNQDLVCCDPSSPRTIDEHVETGLTQPSRFISTTSDSNAAFRWLDKANEMCIFQNLRSVIVYIDVELLKSEYYRIAAAAYDLSNSANRDAFLKSDKQKKFSESYHEVIFIDRIPSDVVSILYADRKGFVANNASGNTRSSILSPPRTLTKPTLHRFPYSIYIDDLDDEYNSRTSSASNISFLPNKQTHPTRPFSSDFQPVSPMNEIKTSSSQNIDPKRATVCRVLPDSAKSLFPVEFNPVRSNYSRSVSSMSKVNNTPLTDHGPVDVTNSSQQTTINPIKPATSTSHLRKTLLKQKRHSPKFLRDSFSSHTNSRPILYPPSPTSLTTELNEKTLIPATLTEKASSVHEPRSKESHSSIFLSNYIQSRKYPDKFESKIKSPTNTPNIATRGASNFNFNETDEAVTPLSQGRNYPIDLDVYYNQLSRDIEASIHIVRKALLFHSKLFRLN